MNVPVNIASLALRSTSLKYVVWRLRRSLQQVGLPGVAGLGFLALCGMYYFSALSAEQTDVKLLQREFDVMQSSPAENTKEQQTGDQLKTFYELFPGVNTAPDTLLAPLHEKALANGVMLDQGEYRLVRNAGDKLVHYEVVLPVKGDYFHIRKFLSQLLADIPYISLDGVEFQRQKISDTTLDAQIKITFFLIDN